MAVDITGRRWNQIINAVNGGMGPEVIKPALSKGELETFKRLDSFKKAEDKKNGYELFYGPVEIESDDPVLNVYND